LTQPLCLACRLKRAKICSIALTTGWGIPALAVWRIILRWIGSKPPDSDGDEGLMLGLIVLLIIAVSLPQILTSLH